MIISQSNPKLLNNFFSKPHIPSAPERGAEQHYFGRQTRFRDRDRDEHGIVHGFGAIPCCLSRLNLDIRLVLRLEVRTARKLVSRRTTRSVSNALGTCQVQ